jgi:hypothetical protein
MLEAFKLGYAVGLGLVAAVITGLIVLGGWEWVCGWLYYLINVIRLTRGREKPRRCTGATWSVASTSSCR